MERILPLRKRIDEIDEHILLFLKERVEVSRTIGSVKKELAIPARDPARENDLYIRIRDRAAQLGLSPDQVAAIYREIIGLCTGVQENRFKTQDRIFKE